MLNPFLLVLFLQHRAALRQAKSRNY